MVLFSRAADNDKSPGGYDKMELNQFSRQSFVWKLKNLAEKYQIYRGFLPNAQRFAAKIVNILQQQTVKKLSNLLYVFFKLA